MRILFDHNVDRRFRTYLPGHEVITTRRMHWEQLANGILLKEAARNRFDAFLTLDKRLRFEQNLATLPLPVILLDARSNAVKALQPFAPHVLRVLSTTLERVIYFVHRDGSIDELRTSP